MNNQVLFDISQKGYDWSTVILGLAFVYAGVTMHKNNSVASTRRSLFTLIVIMGSIVSLGGFLFQLNNRHVYETILRNGQASIVEGEIQDFHPMPIQGHDQETFTVNGVLFAYSDFTITPAFNNTSSHGGPLKGGMFVRIYYTKSREFGGEYAILRIVKLN